MIKIVLEKNYAINDIEYLEKINNSFAQIKDFLETNLDETINGKIAFEIAYPHKILSLKITNEKVNNEYLRVIDKMPSKLIDWIR